jgi:hypothetical protein
MIGCKNNEPDTFGNEETFNGDYVSANDEEKIKFETVYLNSITKVLSKDQSREYNFERKLTIEPVSETIDRTFMHYGDDNGNITMAGKKSTSKSVVGISTEVVNNYYYDGAYCYYTVVDQKSTADNIIYDKVKTEVDSSMVFGFVGIQDYSVKTVYETYAKDSNSNVNLYFDYNHNDNGEVAITKVKLSIRITEAVKKEFNDQKYFEDNAQITVKTAEYYYIFLFDNDNDVVGWRKYILCNYDVKSQGEGSSVMLGVKGAYISEMLIVDQKTVLPEDLSDYEFTDQDEPIVLPGNSVGNFEISLYGDKGVVRNTDILGKITVINFWQMDNSSYIPTLQSIYDYYQGDVNVIAINGDDAYSENIIGYYIKDVDDKNNKEDWSGYDVMFGTYATGNRLFKRFVCKAYPYTAIIDKNGKLVEIFGGEVTETILKNKINKLLEENPS